MTRLTLLAALAALTLAAPVVVAQGAPGGPPNARRQQLEQQIRRSFWRVAKERIGFTDDQMQKLEQTASRFDARRRAHAQQERAQRLVLREELTSRSPDEGRVASALDRLQGLQRERLDIQEAEQKEFAGFMQPSQRAKLAALQEQVRRRAESLRRARPEPGEPMGPPPR